MDVFLRFAEEVIFGIGADRVGEFTIRGAYDKRTAECSWTKQYVGQHSVEYTEQVHERGGIIGQWRIPGQPAFRSGPFCIWPQALGGFELAFEKAFLENDLAAVQGDKMIGELASQYAGHGNPRRKEENYIMRAATTIGVLGLSIFLNLVVMPCSVRADEALQAFERGNAAYGKGEYAKAIADLTEAVRLDPKNAKAYDNRGLAFQQKGEKAKAEEDFARAKELGYEHLVSPSKLRTAPLRITPQQFISSDF